MNAAEKNMNNLQLPKGMKTKGEQGVGGVRDMGAESWVWLELPTVNQQEATICGEQTSSSGSRRRSRRTNRMLTKLISVSLR